MQRAPGPVTSDRSVRRRRPDDPSDGGRGRLRGPGAAAVALFSALAVVGLVGAALVVGTYLALARDLKDPSELERIEFQEESIVLDRTGTTELARFGQTRREVVTFEELPPIVIDATTAVEDKSFWTNPGFDPAAIVAAGLDTLRGDSRGASTITQQLVRQRLLDPELVQDPDRKVERKLKEIIQSIRLTQAYSGEDGKKKVITAYLNQNYYGNQTYGIKAAAKGYFGVDDLNELTLAQAAILAGIPQSPSGYDLYRNAEELDDGSIVVPAEAEIVQRRNFIIDLLAEGRTVLSGDQYDAADFEAAKNEPVVLTPPATLEWTAPHFVWAVRNELAAKLCGEEAQTCPVLERGGLRITTTLDTRLQEIAEKWVKAAAFVPWQDDPKAAAKAIGLDWDKEDWMRNLRGKTLRNGALVALDYQTGELVAYVGSADYYAKGGKRLQTKFDVLADGWRQPGSAFKPFNYAVGIDEGRMTAATMFMDVVTDFGGGYTPTDADNMERGPVRVTDALRFSLNIPAVKAMAVNGIERVYAKARDFGMVFADDKIDAGLAFALGVEEVHPVDLVTAYGTLANGGRRTGHTSILRIQDGAGKDVVPPYERPEGEPVISEQAAWIVTNILAGNTDREINPFWGQFAIRAGKEGGRRPATLKTGTNNDARDLNAYGYIAPPSKEGRDAGEYALAVGAWNGNSDNSLVSKPGAPLFSIDVTTYVWEGFLEEAAADWKVNDFERPGGIAEKRVDPWTGLESGSGRAVTEVFVEGTGPRKAGADRCGLDVVVEAGFEGEHEAWLAADREWIARAARGPGRRGGPENTPTSYFYNGSFTPYGRSWGQVVGNRSGGGGSGASQAPASGEPSGSVDPCASPSPSPSPAPCPSVDPVTGSLAPASGTPSDAPSPDPATCPSPSPSPSPSSSPSPEPSIEPSPSPDPSTGPPSKEPSPSPDPSIEPSPSPAAVPSP